MPTILKALGITLTLCVAPTLAAAQEFGAVNFDLDSDQLDATAQNRVLEIAAKIKANNSYKPSIVVGYTDAVGTSGYNYDLGLRRARVVQNALVAAGVPVERVGTIQSRGEAELLVPVSFPERRNRRVSVALDDVLGACMSYRNVSLTQSSIGDELQMDLVTKLDKSVSVHATYSQNGQNVSALQMAGAATEDCGLAVGLENDSVRKLEYAKKCFCNSARMNVALGK